MTTASESSRSDLDEAITSFGPRLRWARRSTELTRGQLADKLGVKAKTIKSWERDEGGPRPDKLTKLAGLLNVSLRWLLTGDDTDHQGPPGRTHQHVADVQAALLELQDIGRRQAELSTRLGRLEGDLRHLVDQ